MADDAATIDTLIARGTPKVDFSPIGDLPKTYWEGLDQKNKNDLRNVFKDGVPTTADGSPDYQAMSKKLYQLGGLDQGDKFANTDIARQQLKLGQDMSDRLGAMDNGGLPPINAPKVGPVSNTQPTGQPQGQPPVPQAASQTQPQGGYRGGDNGNSIAALVQSRFPAELAGPLINEISAKAGVDPNAPLTPENRQRVAQVAQQVIQAHQNGGQPQQGQPQQPDQVPMPQARPMQAPQMAQPQQAPQAPPVQQQPPQAVPQQQPQTFDSRYGVPPATDTRGSPPTGADPEVQKRIAMFTQIASNPALPEAVRKAAQSRLDALQKSADPTGAMKEYDLARRQGFTGSLQDFEARKESDKTFANKSAETYVKKYEGIQDLGQKALQELPQIQLIKNMMDDPTAGFYSGVGEKYNLAIKRALTAVGGDPNSALPQEAFRKVVSGNILNSLGQLKGLGQIRVAEINLAKEASASADNTPAGNRLLVTVSQRMHQRASEVADMAQNYNGGRLDAGFDKIVTDYNKAHPIFSDEELKNPKLLSLPHFDSPEMARKAPKGTEFVASDGKIRRVP